MIKKRIILLGATGSIGSQTLDCIEAENRRGEFYFELAACSTHRNIHVLHNIHENYPDSRCAATGILDPIDWIDFHGPRANQRLIEETDAELVVNGIAGAAGLEASILTLASGKNLALANKESVVMGFAVLEKLAHKNSCSILPVDSEHSALFQLISRIGIDSIDELTITASGGPFFNYSIEDLATVDADAAARHPVWKMGRKISIDSSTLANKGLELIEAARLFHMSEDSIQVLIHPQSLVHALVRSRDGSLFAHMSLPDMRLPIELALRWPMETSSNFPRLDLVGKSLSFFQPDEKKFPLIRLARDALRLGDSATIAYNAANEVAVEAFDKGLIRFLDIPRIVDSVLQSDWSASVEDFFSILDYDRKARSLSNKALLELIR